MLPWGALWNGNPISNNFNNHSEGNYINEVNVATASKEVFERLFATMLQDKNVTIEKMEQRLEQMLAKHEQAIQGLPEKGPRGFLGMGSGIKFGGSFSYPCRLWADFFPFAHGYPSPFRRTWGFFHRNKQISSGDQAATLAIFSCFCFSCLILAILTALAVWTPKTIHATSVSWVLARTFRSR